MNVVVGGGGGVSAAALAMSGSDHPAVLELPRSQVYPVALEAADGGLPGDLPGHGVLHRGDLRVHLPPNVLRCTTGAF